MSPTYINNINRNNSQQLSRELFKKILILQKLCKLCIYIKKKVRIYDNEIIINPLSLSSNLTL